MLRLRKILLCDSIYIGILLIVLIISIIRINIKPNLLYKEDSTITGIIQNIEYEEDYYKLTIKGKEKVLGSFYSKNKIDIHLGDKIKVSGIISEPTNPTLINTFNYKQYLNNKNIYHLINIDSIKVISKNRNIYYKVKEFVYKRLNHNKCLYTFIVGDKFYLSQEIKNSYQENGISHLFAISGMHITLLSNIIMKILSILKVKEHKKYLITSILLFIYLLIVGITPSILRGVLFFIVFKYNNLYYFYIKPTNLFILVLSISLLINPKYIFEVSFQYSYLISFTLIYMSEFLTSKNYFISLIKTSTISSIVSLPISLYNFYSINILSIIYNLFFIPLITIIVFPLSLITFIFPQITPIYNFITDIMENISIVLSKIKLGKLVFMKIHPIFYILYLIIIFIVFYFIKKNNFKYSFILLSILLIHYIYPSIKNDVFINFIDVGQGDSILIHNRKIILIDTGGKESNSNNNSIVINKTIPYLKSLGIKKLDYLILTHGDYDHMGESINLVEKYKVKNVIFNCGEFNNLERELITKLNKNKVSYYSCINELDLENNKLFFLQTREYDNENDNSNVIYTEINNYKFIFTGDASINTEKEILKDYNLPEIDVLKVGHHGSKTSSSKEFINEINPKYSIISVGKDNRYGHPNKEALDNLENSKIYRTDQDGSIMFRIKNNKLEIEACSP